MIFSNPVSYSVCLLC